MHIQDGRRLGSPERHVVGKLRACLVRLHLFPSAQIVFLMDAPVIHIAGLRTGQLSGYGQRLCQIQIYCRHRGDMTHLFVGLRIKDHKSQFVVEILHCASHLCLQREVVRVNVIIVVVGNGQRAAHYKYGSTLHNVRGLVISQLHLAPSGNRKEGNLVFSLFLRRRNVEAHFCRHSLKYAYRIVFLLEEQRFVAL